MHDLDRTQLEMETDEYEMNEFDTESEYDNEFEFESPFNEADEICRVEVYFGWDLE